MALVRNCTDLCIPDPAASTFIEYKNLQFLITRCPYPSEIGMEKYLEELKYQNVKLLVRVTDHQYNIVKFLSEGVHVVDLHFPDGATPSNDVVEAWFKLLRDRVIGNINFDACIAVHCVSGLGRSPLLVALALIELGISNEEVIELIRSKRRGAFNKSQLAFLKNFKPKSRLVVKNRSARSTIATKLRRLSTIVYN